MKFGQFMSYYKKQNHQKILQKLWPGKQFQALFCLQRIKRNFYWKNFFLKQATYISYVTAKLSKFIQNQHVDLLRIIFTKDFLKIKKGVELVSRPHFSQNFDKKFNFVILHKLVKFLQQIVFTYQVIQYYVFCVSCLGT